MRKSYASSVREKKWLLTQREERLEAEQSMLWQENKEGIIFREEWIMSIFKTIQPRTSRQIPEPPIAKFLFADTRMVWFWLIVRLYVGYEWLTASWEKLTGHSIAIGSFGEAAKNLFGNCSQGPSIQNQNQVSE